MIALDLIGAETVRMPDGRLIAGPGCDGAAARRLLADGVPPDARLTFRRDGVPALTGTVRAFAWRAWAGAADDPAFRTWRPARFHNAVSRVDVGGKGGLSGRADTEAPETGKRASCEGGAA